MDRRQMLGTLGAAAAGLGAAGGVAHAQQEKGHDHHKKGDVHHKCAEACFHCAHECSEGFHHCFEQAEAGKKNYAKAMHLCRDCADVCATAGKLVGGMSPLMAHTCHACAECCDDCVAECQKLNDPEMKEVVAALKACAASCREMAKAMGGDDHHEKKS